MRKYRKSKSVLCSPCASLWQRNILVLLLSGLCCILPSVQAAEIYHTNRTFKPVTFNIQGTPTVEQLYMEAGKLTDIVKGTNITINTNETYAIEKQAIAVGFDSAADAWNAAVNYSGPSNTHLGKIFDNAGWVRGTKSVKGAWGAYLWTMQNKIAFKSSTTNIWVSSNGIPVAISNVFVGSLGVYGPMSNVVDIGPDISPATNFPGEGQSSAGTYYADITNVYYQLIIPNIWITPRSAVTCVGGSNVQYTVTGTNIPNGVTWKIIPEGVSATIQTNIDWHYASVTPGNVATNYKIRATSKDNTNFYDQVDLKVVKVDILETNIYIAVSNLATLHLTADSIQDAEWEIIPNLEGQGRAYFEGSESGSSVDINAGSLPTNYTVKAYYSGFTNCSDTCTVNVIKVALTNMAFSGGWDLTRDTGGTYPTVHWSVTNTSPYLYQRSTQVNLSATFKVEPSDFTGNITISGDGPGNIDFTNVTVSASGGQAIYPATNSIGTLTNQVDFWNPMTINWKYNVGVSSNCHAGSSANKVYVCLASPASVPTLYHTVVHLACAAGNATNEAGAVLNTWSQLSGHNFTTWDGRALYYYKDGVGWDSPGFIRQLLNTGNGNCVAWRNLFRHALKINGVNSDYIYVQATDLGPTNRHFIVGDWTFGTASFTNTPPYNWKLQFATNGPPADMVPRPPGDVYGDLTSLTTIEGQNTAPPSEKVFGNHRMARYNGVYYDPSYGVTHVSINSFVDAAIDGYAYRKNNDPTTNYVIRVKSASGVYEIGEWVNHPEDETDGLP